MSSLSSQQPKATLLTAIDFYFDFASPYGYLASEVIDALGAQFGRQVNWHPLLLGAAFKVTGAALPVRQPLKSDYFVHDFARSARFYDVPFVQPMKFPLSTQHAARAFLWVYEANPLAAKGLAHAIFRAYFTAGRDIDQIDTVLDIAASLGHPRPALSEALAGVAIKERLHAEVDRALARGVFGSPFFLVDGEAFWGMDRLPQLERWLLEGGF
ncbi:MAG: oxidoreductase [Rhodocyclales bacterium]|nr:oxidoreductase [Rhodocyclales bacterium]